MACAALVALAPGLARAGEEQEIELAQRHVDEFAYDKAASRIEVMLDPNGPACPKTPEISPAGCRLTDRGFVRRARGLYAIALHGLKRPSEAQAQFRQLLLDDPTFTPSPAEYPPEVIRLFTEAKKAVEDEITARTIAEQTKQKEYEDSIKAYEAWVDTVEGLAKTETVVAERSRLIAAVPFGVGQFQNDSVGLGVLFLSLEAAFLSAGVVTGAYHAHLVEANIATPTASAAEDLETLKVINITSMALLAATMIAGIIEAEVNFEAEVQKTRPRAIQPRPPKPVPPRKVSLEGVPGAPDAVGLGLKVQF